MLTLQHVILSLLTLSQRVASIICKPISGFSLYPMYALSIAFLYLILTLQKVMFSLLDFYSVPQGAADVAGFGQPFLFRVTCARFLLVSLWQPSIASFIEQDV